MLARNWNRNDNQHIFFTQRYSVGFKHKVPMTAEEIAARKFAMASQLEAKQRRAKAEAVRKARQEGEDVDEDDVKAPATFAGRPDNAKIGVRAKRDSLANDSLEGGLQAPSRLAVNGKALPTACWRRPKRPRWIPRGSRMSMCLSPVSSTRSTSTTIVASMRRIRRRPIIIYIAITSQRS